MFEFESSQLAHSPFRTGKCQQLDRIHPLPLKIFFNHKNIDKENSQPPVFPHLSTIAMLVCKASGVAEASSMIRKVSIDKVRLPSWNCQFLSVTIICKKIKIHTSPTTPPMHFMKHWNS